MSKAGHTPGPWKVVRSVTCGHLRAGHNYRADPKQEWTHADIQLIQAAPDLLEALQKIAALRWGFDGDCGATAIAEAAITRACE